MTKSAAVLACLLGAVLFPGPATAQYAKELEGKALDCLEPNVARFDDLLSEADVVSGTVLEDCGNMLHARDKPFLGNDLLNLQNWQKVARPLALQAVLKSRVRARSGSGCSGAGGSGGQPN